MHNTLRVERYADAAELPHGFLLAPNVAALAWSISRVSSRRSSRRSVRPPFFHIGSDETATLGLGRTQAYVAQRGRSQVYAEHVVAMNRLIAPSGARMMLWDDGIESDPGIMQLIPRTRGGRQLALRRRADASSRYIQTIARGGFEQMVAPGCEQLERDLSGRRHGARQRTALYRRRKGRGRARALPNRLARRRRDALRSDVVSGDLRGGRCVAERRRCTREQFAADFPHAFFGVDDPSYGSDVHACSARRCGCSNRPTHSYGQTDALFWADPFDPAAAAQVANVDLRPRLAARPKRSKRTAISRRRRCTPTPRS